MNNMQLSDNSFSALRVSMAMFATLALMLGAAMSLSGQPTLALTNFCGALFFIFAYHNPEIMLSGDMIKVDISPEKIVQKKFLWASLAVAVITLALEFKSHLPLG